MKQYKDKKTLYYFLKDTEQLESIDEKFTGIWEKDKTRFKKYTDTDGKVRDIIGGSEGAL
jgi:hypothetical protein